jgi:hypothetical protein
MIPSEGVNVVPFARWGVRTLQPGAGAPSNSRSGLRS